jgi:hypothetical protein
VPILNVAAAVACAVAHATGRTVRQIPLTPPRVLDLIDGVEPSGPPLDQIKRRWSDNLLA